MHYVSFALLFFVISSTVCASPVPIDRRDTVTHVSAIAKRELRGVPATEFESLWKAWKIGSPENLAMPDAKEGENKVEFAFVHLPESPKKSSKGDELQLNAVMKRIRIYDLADWKRASEEIENLAAIYGENSFSWGHDRIPGAVLIGFKTGKRMFHSMTDVEAARAESESRAQAIDAMLAESREAVRKAVESEHPGIKLGDNNSNWIYYDKSSRGSQAAFYI